MIEISSESPENSMLPFVKNWMKLLAQGKADEACAQLDEPNSYGITWSPNLIGEILEDFGPHNVFTDPFELPNSDHIAVFKFNDGSGYAFDHPIPINGEWSDLTAQFEFLKRPNGYAVVLHDFHVL